jgi:hypothetical protein
VKKEFTTLNALNYSLFVLKTESMKSISQSEDMADFHASSTIYVLFSLLGSIRSSFVFFEERIPAAAWNLVYSVFFNCDLTQWDDNYSVAVYSFRVI